MKATPVAPPPQIIAVPAFLAPARGLLNRYPDSYPETDQLPRVFINRMLLVYDLSSFVTGSIGMADGGYRVI